MSLAGLLERERRREACVFCPSYGRKHPLASVFAHVACMKRGVVCVRHDCLYVCVHLCMHVSPSPHTHQYACAPVILYREPFQLE